MLKKLETAKTCYEAALKQHEAHKSELASIEAELAKLAAERHAFEQAVHDDALSQGVSIELRESQQRDYQRLREQCAKHNVTITEQLDALQREHKLDQDALDNEARKRGDSLAKLKQKRLELDEQRSRLAKLVEYITGSEAQLAEQTTLERQMSAEIETARTSSVDIENELAKCMGELGDARLDKFETSRSQKRTEVIDQLKKKFPTGVYGRLVDHCEPVHRKYQLAITKVHFYFSLYITISKQTSILVSFFFASNRKF